MTSKDLQSPSVLGKPTRNIGVTNHHGDVPCFHNHNPVHSSFWPALSLWI